MMNARSESRTTSTGMHDDEWRRKLLSRLFSTDVNQWIQPRDRAVTEGEPIDRSAIPQRFTGDTVHDIALALSAPAGQPASTNGARRRDMNGDFLEEWDKLDRKRYVRGQALKLAAECDRHARGFRRAMQVGVFGSVSLATFLVALPLLPIGEDGGASRPSHPKIEAARVAPHLVQTSSVVRDDITRVDERSPAPQHATATAAFVPTSAAATEAADQGVARPQSRARSMPVTATMAARPAAPQRRQAALPEQVPAQPNAPPAEDVVLQPVQSAAAPAFGAPMALGRPADTALNRGDEPIARVPTSKPRTEPKPQSAAVAATRSQRQPTVTAPVTAPSRPVPVAPVVQRRQVEELSWSPFRN